jgi:hypothetical protein
MDTVGLYDPVKGQFYLQNDHKGGSADISFFFGPLNNGWLPISGDWDKDGMDTVGLYDPVNSRFYLRNTHAGGLADQNFSFGPLNNDWLPISGDWDNDDMDTVGLYDSVDRRFYLRNAHTGGFADQNFSFGPLNNDWLPISLQTKNQSCDEVQVLSLPSVRTYYNSLRGTTRSFRIEAERLADGHYHQLWFDKQAGQLGSYKLVTITQCPNDFDTLGIDRQCWEEDWTATILMRNQKGSIGCFVKPGMDYFINIMDLNCQGNCGYVMTFR